MNSSKCPRRLKCIFRKHSVEPEVLVPTSQLKTLGDCRNAIKFAMLPQLNIWQFKISGFGVLFPPLLTLLRAIESIPFDSLNLANCSKFGLLLLDQRHQKSQPNYLQGIRADKTERQGDSLTRKAKSPPSRHTCREGNSTSGCLDNVLVEKADKEAFTNQQF